MERQCAAQHASLDPAARCAGFAALYDAHIAEVYRFVHRRCRDHSIAEDVTQDTFLAAFRAIDDPASIDIGWLMRVARNRLIDIVRRRTRYSDKLRLVRPRPTASDPGTTVPDQLRVNEVFDQLDVEDRLTLALHYVDGLTIAELADEFGRSPKSIEARVTRARRNFRRELELADE